MTEECEAERNWRVQTLRSVFAFFVVLLFLFSSINDEISLACSCFSSFDLSNKLGSIVASHSDSSSSEKYFTITAEILARSLANFYRQYADRHMNLKFDRATRERARAGNSTICYRKKQIDVSFSCVCPVIDNEFRHHIVKVVCGSTRLSPRGSTATLTM